jgi:hypothetical protein
VVVRRRGPILLSYTPYEKLEFAADTMCVRVCWCVLSCFFHSFTGLRALERRGVRTAILLAPHRKHSKRVLKFSA